MNYPCDVCRVWLPGLLADHQIRHLAQDHGMISPFEPRAVRTNAKGERILSRGCGSYGYDFSVFDEWHVFAPTGRNVVVDPKNMDMNAFVTVRGDGSVVIPPNGFVLARTIERFVIPSDVLGTVTTKSSLARCGINMQCTPLESSWEGYLTVEVGNTTPHGARVYAEEGIGQVLFFKGSAPCDRTYANKNEGGTAGKYQSQPAEIVLPRL